MVYGSQGVTIPGLLAGASLAAHQYKAVKCASTAGEVIVCAATTDVAIGILQNDPADGEPAIVMAFGVSKAVAGPTDLNYGDILGYNTTGQVADHTTSGRRTIGICLTDQGSGTAADLVSILVNASNEL